MMKSNEEPLVMANGCFEETFGGGGGFMDWTGGGDWMLGDGINEFD